jgi:hypothetical protein
MAPPKPALQYLVFFSEIEFLDHTAKAQILVKPGNSDDKDFPGEFGQSAHFREQANPRTPRPFALCNFMADVRDRVRNVRDLDAEINLADHDSHRRILPDSSIRSHPPAGKGGGS